MAITDPEIKAGILGQGENNQIAYCKPRLRVFGRISELTAGGSAATLEWELQTVMNMQMCVMIDMNGDAATAQC